MWEGDPLTFPPTGTALDFVICKLCGALVQSHISSQPLAMETLTLEHMTVGRDPNHLYVMWNASKISIKKKKETVSKVKTQREASRRRNEGFPGATSGLMPDDLSATITPSAGHRMLTSGLTQMEAEGLPSASVSQ